MKKKFHGIVITMLVFATLFSVAGNVNANWPMFGSNPQHTRFADTAGPANNNSLWVLDADSFSNAAIIVDGIVYTNGVHTYDAMNGELLSSSINITKSDKCPAVYNGFLYTGDRQELGYPAYIYCINISTMETKWVFNPGYYPPENIVAIDGKVIFAVREKVYCLDASTGVELWSKDGCGSGSPAVAHDRVYISYNTKLNCLNIVDGELLWSETISDSQSGNHPPVVADGNVYILADMPNDKSMHSCFNAIDGSLVWQVILDGKPAVDERDQSSAIAYEKYYYASGRIGTGAGKLYRLNASTGVTELSITFEDNMYSKASPAISNDGNLYVGLSYIGSGGISSGRILCLDTMTFETIWSEDLDSYIKQSPKLYGGRVYVASSSKLYCFGTNRPPEIPVIDEPTPAIADINEDITFNINGTTDPDLAKDKFVYYKLDWGDGSSTSWLGPYNEGEPVETVTHSYSKPGSKEVRVRAKDAYGAESEYSTPSVVYIKSLQLNVPNGSGLQRMISFSILNVGDASKDVNWTVVLEGGLLPDIQLNKRFADTDESTPGVNLGIAVSFFGFGKFTITITVESPGEPTLEETFEGVGLFFWIKIP